MLKMKEDTERDYEGTELPEISQEPTTPLHTEELDTETPESPLPQEKKRTPLPIGGIAAASLVFCCEAYQVRIYMRYTHTT
jgi:hypothetical protein